MVMVDNGKGVMVPEEYLKNGTPDLHNTVNPIATFTPSAPSNSNPSQPTPQAQQQPSQQQTIIDKEASAGQGDMSDEQWQYVLQNTSKPLVATLDKNNNIVATTSDNAITYEQAKKDYASRYGATAAENASISELTQTEGKPIGISLTKSDLPGLDNPNQLSNGYTVLKASLAGNNDIGFAYQKGNDINTLLNNDINSDTNLTELDRYKLNMLVADQRPKTNDTVNATLAALATSDKRINLGGGSLNNDTYLVDNPYTGKRSIIDSRGEILPGYSDMYFSPYPENNPLPRGTSIGGKEIINNTDISRNDFQEPKTNTIENTVGQPPAENKIGGVDVTTMHSTGELRLPSETDNQNGLLWGSKYVWVDPISLGIFKNIEATQEDLAYNKNFMGPFAPVDPISKVGTGLVSFGTQQALSILNMLPGAAMTIEASLQNPSGFDEELTHGRNLLPLNPIYDENNNLVVRGSNGVVQGGNVANAGLMALLTGASMKMTPEITPASKINIEAPANAGSTEYTGSVSSKINPTVNSIGRNIALNTAQESILNDVGISLARMGRNSIDDEIVIKPSSNLKYNDVFRPPAEQPVKADNPQVLLGSDLYNAVMKAGSVERARQYTLLGKTGSAREFAGRVFDENIDELINSNAVKPKTVMDEGNKYTVFDSKYGFNQQSYYGKSGISSYSGGVDAEGFYVNPKGVEGISRPVEPIRNTLTPLDEAAPNYDWLSETDIFIKSNSKKQPIGIFKNNDEGYTTIGDMYGGPASVYSTVRNIFAETETPNKINSMFDDNKFSYKSRVKNNDFDKPYNFNLYNIKDNTLLNVKSISVSKSDPMIIAAISNNLISNFKVSDLVLSTSITTPKSAVQTNSLTTSMSTSKVNNDYITGSIVIPQISSISKDTSLSIQDITSSTASITKPLFNEPKSNRYYEKNNPFKQFAMPSFNLPSFGLGSAGGGGFLNGKHKAMKNTRNKTGNLPKLIGLTNKPKNTRKSNNKTFRGLL